VEAVDQTDMFEAERSRLVGIASRVLGDHAEAQDVVQQAWLRLHATDTEINTLPAWLTTVTTRLYLDRLRSRTPVPVPDVEPEETVNDPADDVALADTVGLALHVVLDRLSPRERVAFVLHDSFGFEFPTIAGSWTPRRRPHASWPRGREPRSPSPIWRTGWPTGKWSTPSWPQPRTGTSTGCYDCSHPRPP
jgi:RNA polymerase sigma factor (sigma-70 family)